MAKEGAKSNLHNECPKCFKVELATYQFENEVEYWWETIKPHEGEKALTWATFKNLMDAKYYPKDVKLAKEQEFIKFKQRRTMSVMEYAPKFNELSRFAPV